MNEQLLFPFVLDFYIKEIPYVLEQHREYVIKTQTAVSLDEFVTEKYKNEPHGEKYRFYEHPLHKEDGIIVTWVNYLK